LEAWTLTSHLLLPLGLGLLGFIEPCTIGGHMLLLGSLSGESRTARLATLAAFTVSRSLTLGLIGVLVVAIGQHFVGGQKGLWFVFGLIYIGLGVAYLTGRISLLMQRIGLNQRTSPKRRSAITLGVLLGFNVPACAAPLLFAVIGSTMLASSFTSGFVTMALFGFALSAPLFLVNSVGWMQRIVRAASDEPSKPFLRRVIGGVLLAVGAWSLWFALFVNPADWQIQ
jgi:cytochrome c-type biogenesis protein